jgi:phosphatidylinositol glycan class B
MARSPPTTRSANYINFQDVFIIRLVNALCIATFFQPDEFFQSLEPAWQIAFGPDSGAWLTWEWHHHLRSSLHPAIFSGAYLAAEYVARLLPPGSPWRSFIVSSAPKLPQAFFAALGDYYTWKLAVKIYGRDTVASLFALALQLLSPWQWFCSTRTFSNSLETTLTIMALYYWPWQLFQPSPQPPIKENSKATLPPPPVSHFRASLCLAAFAVVLRPTNLFIWATVAIVSLVRVSTNRTAVDAKAAVLTLVRETLLCGSLVLAISFCSDRLYFGTWTVPPYHWLNFNISKSLAVFYGRNPWHYYLLQGIPLLCTTSLPFAARALYKPSAATEQQLATLRTLTYTVFTTVLALSLISHKEVRFIYPLLPSLNILAAPLAASFFVRPKQKNQQHSPSKEARRIRNKPYLLAAIVVNILLAGFLSFLHQPAPINVLSFLRHEYERIHPHPAAAFLGDEAVATDARTKQPNELFVLFLMPCHSTPWRSHLVYPQLSAYALTCEPPLHTLPGTPERELYRDEADRFYDNPVPFLQSEMFPAQQPRPLPRFIAGFEGIEPWLREFLETTPEGRATGIKYLKLVWSGFNGFFNEDSRRRGRMLVWDTGLYDDNSAATKT